MLISVPQCYRISFWSLRALMEKMKKRRAAMEVRVNLILLFVFDGSYTIFLISFNQRGSVVPCYNYLQG